MAYLPTRWGEASTPLRPPLALAFRDLTERPDFGRADLGSSGAFPAPAALLLF